MRLFVAAWPPGSVLDQLRALHRPTIAGVRWTTTDQWHVTVGFAGEVAPALVDPLVADLSVALRHLDRAMVEVGPRAVRLGPSVLCLPAEGLENVAAAVRPVVEGTPPSMAPRPFRGHLTLARGRGGRRLPQGSLGDLVLSSRFSVDELALVASELLPGGARYRTLTRLALGS